MYDKALSELNALLTSECNCPSFWVMRGDLIQLGENASTPPLTEAAASYKKALELDPNDLEAIESLAHFFDAVISQPTDAKQYARAYIEKVDPIRSAMLGIIESN